MRPAILSGAMAIPVERVNVPALRKALTAKYQPMGADEALLVEAFDIDDDFIHVPRQFGLGYCKRHGIPFEDQTSPGTAVVFPKTPTPRDYQETILPRIIGGFDHYYDFIFKAHTGWGKTIGALIVAAQLGTTTLIIVDQDNLKEQWLKALNKFFGMTLENGMVGVVQGKKSDYEGKAVVIGMVQTLSQKEYEPEFYEYFGLVLVDEVHTCGAPTFSIVLRLFSATYRLGVSATPTRRDGLQKLLEYNLGAVRVAAEKEHNESAVYIREHGTVYSWYGNVSKMVGRILTEITEDGSRNLLLAESILGLYETGRDVLVLSDRIDQLKHLMSLLYYHGVDESEMGLYAGYEPIFQYAKETKPKRRPYGYERGLAYSPVGLQLIAKRISKRDLAHRKGHAKILFATYGMAAKGFDEPRLKAGVDASPRGEVEQIHGRILREVPGALMPIWVTIFDKNNPRLVFSFLKRITGYLKSKGRMYKWEPDGELIACEEAAIIGEAKQRAKELRSMRIETLRDGRNTLVTSKSSKAQEKQRAIATVKTIRSRSHG